MKASSPELTREEFKAVLDSMNPAASPAASRAYEKLHTAELTSVEIVITVKEDKAW